MYHWVKIPILPREPGLSVLNFPRLFFRCIALDSIVIPDCERHFDPQHHRHYLLTIAT
jgi:hypothetical protein